MLYHHQPLCSPTLEAVAAELEAWRRDFGRPKRIPDELWLAAIELCDTQGVCRVCRTLRLSPDTLRRKRDELSTGASPAKRGVAQLSEAEFAEWLPRAIGGAGKIRAAVRFPSGIHVKLVFEGTSVLDVAAMLRELAR